MRIFTVVFTMTIITLLFGSILNKIEIIDQLENQLEKQHHHYLNQTDSLIHEIDTLIWEEEWDSNKYESIDTTIIKWPWGREEIYYFKYKNVDMHHSGALLNSLIFVESRGNDSAYCANEDAVGCLQIRKCMVDDINRILRRQKSYIRFSYNDRWLRQKSIEMFEIYCKYYGLTTAEEIARCWNGGPRGINNPATVGYWNKVKSKIDS